MPSGTVTFLFTDLEGSTRLWEEHPEGMHDALARHDAILRAAIEVNGGYVVKTLGDGVHACFATADVAVSAAIAAQQALTSEPWGETGPLRVRMGLHTGSAEVRGGDYYGPALNRAARVMAAAHGGQVICSQVTADMLHDELDESLELTDLGVHRLRDLGRPERVFQLSAPGMASEFPALRTLDAFSSNLPVQLTSFVGRDGELAEVRGLLARERLVTLTGVGGVGKTRLALQVAGEVLPGSRDGVWLCELAAADEPDSMAPVVAASLGVSPRPGMPLRDSIVQFLRFKELLVVLDNCEHLLEAASELAAAVLVDCPQVRILATSRETLGVPGERVVRLRSLSVPDRGAGDLRSIEGSDAVRLFAERAATTGSRFALGPSNASAVAEICRRLDGIPLAIELAAARVESMQPGEIASRLDERFRLLTGRRRAVLERHQTLRATVDWSYSLLNERECVIFDRLGVFPGTFDITAAEAVVAGDTIGGWEVVDALDALVAKSMVAVEESAGDSTRFQMLETLRQYARERLDEAGDADVWRRRHAEHYAEFAEMAGAALYGPDELVWRRRYLDEIDNLRVAVGWALDRDTDADRELAMRIIAGLSNQANADRTAEIGSWAQRAVRDADRTTPGRRSAIFTAAGWHALAEGDREAARALASDALRDGPPDDWLASSQPFALLGVIQAFAGEPEQAIATVAEGRAALETRGNAHPTGRAMLATSEASFRALAGDTAGAEAAAPEVIRLARESGNPTALAAAVMPALVATWKSQPDRAAALADESIALVRAGAGGPVFGYAVAIKAQLLARAANRAGALAALREAISYSHDKGDLPMLVLTLDRGIQVLAALGEHEPAAIFAGIAITGPLKAVSNLPAAEHSDREQALDLLRAKLGEANYEATLQRGTDLSYDEVIQYALGELDRISARGGS